jgi:hypothetical protein
LYCRLAAAAGSGIGGGHATLALNGFSRGICNNSDVPPVRTVRVTRYVTPLREGGSLPAIVEADDDGMYVLKFRGAGQGVRALIAELLAGEVARAAGLPVPEIVFADVDVDLARTEPDPEIHALIKSSAGLNLALDYLPGSVMFDPAVERPDAELSSRIVWFDAYVSNVDRTPRNTNMLMWHRQLWLIDHGASLYFHHTIDWQQGPDRSRQPFPLIKDHVLRRHARLLAEVDEAMVAALGGDVIAGIVDLIPDVWLQEVGADGVAVKAGYRRYLQDRLQAPRAFVHEATRAD